VKQLCMRFCSSLLDAFEMVSTKSHCRKIGILAHLG
jgi:hypothetical protein